MDQIRKRKRKEVLGWTDGRGGMRAVSDSVRGPRQSGIRCAEGKYEGEYY